VAQILRARNSELAELETRDTGKPIQETSLVDIQSGADCLEYYAGLALTMVGDHIDLGNAHAKGSRRNRAGDGRGCMACGRRDARVWINHYNITPVAMPFGGRKLSGLGRENAKRPSPTTRR
jgi:acyl-CoA reductase-like NAD-dependent aldehyde dehydrogenase